MAKDDSIKWKSAQQSDTSNKVKSSLVIKLNGSNPSTFDGSSAVNVNITPSSIGAALSNHTHSNYALKDHDHNQYMRYRGALANDNAIDNTFTSGYYYLSGGQYHILNYNYGYGWLAVYADDTVGTSRAITQVFHSDKYIFTRLWSGSPGSWGPWYRSGSPIIIVDTEYGNHILQSETEYVGPTITIDWEGWYLIYMCAYSNTYNSAGCSYGILQASALIDNSRWIVDTQSLNEYIAAPSVSGTMMFYFYPGQTIAYRLYYAANHNKNIELGYTYFKLFRLT